MLPIEIKMRRSVDLPVPVIPAMPPQFVVTRATIAHAGALAELLGRAYPTETWNAKGTEIELFQDETIKDILIASTNGCIVATASLQVQSGLTKSGQLRWVATEQDWRRKGLAKSLVIELLTTAKHYGCADTQLQTTTDLLGAISMYKQLGFEPLTNDSSNSTV